jgi:hypothetical protein
MGVCFKNLILAAWKPVFCRQPSDEDVEFSAPPSPCLPGCCHVPTLMIMAWTSEPVSQPQLNVVLIRVALVAGWSWRTPLIPALGRQRQANFWVWGQPGLQSEFQDSQGYTEKPCLKKKKVSAHRGNNYRTVYRVGKFFISCASHRGLKSRIHTKKKKRLS